MHKVSFCIRWWIFLGICMFALNAESSFASENLKKSMVKIAIGSYFSLGPVTHSMVLRSEDNGESWIQTGNIPDDTYLADLHCSAKTCIVIAKNLRDQNYQASLLISQNKGKSWSQRTHIYGFPNSVTCKNDLCMMVGSNHDKPMVSLSNDGGDTWTIEKKISNLPEELNGILNKISCSDNDCLAVGTTTQPLNSDLPNLPIFVISSDHGQTWSFVQDVHNLPTNIKRIDHLDKIKCSHNTCIAAGSYSATDNEWNSHVLLLASHDSGKSWTFIKEIPELENLGGFQLSIDDLVYSNGSIIVVGGYSETEGLLKSLILVSKDDGHRWSLVKGFSNTLNKNLGWLKSVSCSDNTCVAVGAGFYEDGTNFGLTLLVSKDNGLSWSLVPYVAGTAYTPNINVVQCSSTHCIAMGSFSDNNNNSHPVVLTSSNKGKSWSVVSKLFDFRNVDKVLFTSVVNIDTFTD